MQQTTGGWSDRSNQPPNVACVLVDGAIADVLAERAAFARRTFGP